MIIVTFLMMFLGLIVRNYHLAKVLFYDWDEGMYAQIATEVLKNKSIFTTFNGQLFLAHPPLTHLLLAPIFFIFGHSEFWARMLSVFISFLLLILLYSLAKKITKNIVASLLPVLTLAASPIFLERATMLNSDIFVALSWVGYFLFWDKYWLKILFFAIGVWSKSVLGFYPFIFEILYRLIQIVFYRKKFRFNFNLVLKGCLLVFIPSLWYLAGILKYGYFFIQYHFLNQVFKRLYVPIELHFGNKFFYFSYLWQNLRYINLLLVISYLLLGFNLLKKRKIKLYDLIYISPLPFFALLTLMRTKITWYVIIFLPLLTLLIAYLYSKINSIYLKLLIIFVIVFYFVSNFIPQTFLLKPNYTKPNNLILAQCLSKTKVDKIAFLVDEEERKIRNFLEASHYDTATSFFFGGSPSFVFYLNKKVDYFYDPVKFSKEKNKYSVIVVSLEDWDKKNSVICQAGNWLGLKK